MGAENFNFNELLGEIKRARETLDARDQKTAARLDEIERGLNALHLAAGRPGGEGAGEPLARKEGRAYAVERHSLLTVKADGGAEYEPSRDEVDDAIAATLALKKVIRFGVGRLDHLQTKSLSSFNLGSLGWVLPPAWSARILSCLTDQSDLTGLVSSEVIGGPSIKFPIDNQEFSQDAAWACQADCFANNPAPNVANLGELEVKAEELRFAICAGVDLLEDAGFSVEGWLQGKVATAFRDAISAAIVTGDGLGRPQGFLFRGAGVPICDTAEATPTGQFNWQDLVMLAYQIPMKWHNDLVFLMNQKTLALCLTMSDAAGRPILLPSARDGAGRFTIAGFPVVVATQMPDCQPGSCRVLAANLRELYSLVIRRGTSMLTEPIGWCRLFRFSNRTGGSVLCPNAGRLLRIR